MKNFSCVKWWNFYQWPLDFLDDMNEVLEKYDIKALEELAVELYKSSRHHLTEIPREQMVEIIDSVLYQRCIILNNDHKWTEENVNAIVKISELFASAAEKACKYAELIVDKIEPQKSGNSFLMDYEIEIKLSPYLQGYEKYEAHEQDIGIINVLCEPLDRRVNFPLICDYDDDKYYDRSDSWNTDYFWDENLKPLDCFKDKYISYAIHEMLDNTYWSFQDIINIDMICAEVKLNYQSFLRNNIQDKR